MALDNPMSMQSTTCIVVGTPQYELHAMCTVYWLCQVFAWLWSMYHLGTIQVIDCLWSQSNRIVWILYRDRMTSVCDADYTGILPHILWYQFMILTTLITDKMNNSYQTCTYMYATDLKLLIYLPNSVIKSEQIIHWIEDFLTMVMNTLLSMLFYIAGNPIVMHLSTFT